MRPAFSRSVPDRRGARAYEPCPRSAPTIACPCSGPVSRGLRTAPAASAASCPAQMQDLARVSVHVASSGRRSRTSPSSGAAAETHCDAPRSSACAPRTGPTPAFGYPTESGPWLVTGREHYETVSVDKLHNELLCPLVSAPVAISGPRAVVGELHVVPVVHAEPLRLQLIDQIVVVRTEQQEVGSFFG